MKISPININSNKFSVNSISSSVNFTAHLPVVKDTYDMNTVLNSDEIVELIKKKDFNEAYNAINKLPINYDPNWQDQSGKPLLLIIADAKCSFPFVDFTKKQSTIKDNIMMDIISNPNFAPNKEFELIDKKGNHRKTSYLDYAVENNNLHLILLLMNYARNMLDPHNDCFNTLLGKTMNSGNSNVRLAIQALQDNIPASSRAYEVVSDDDIDDAEDIDEDRQNQEELINEEGAKLLDASRVFIPKSLPSSINDIGGLSKAKKDIENYILRPWSQSTRATFEKNNIKLPSGFLMYGPSGSGKTYIVSVIAKQTGYPLYSINIGNIGSKWMSETPKNLNNIFEELDNRYQKTGIPSILFIDEIDDMGGTREGNNSAGKREDLNALLLLLNNAAERGIIVIGATNYIDIVDKALMRSGRFDKKIEVLLPDRDERKDILIKLIGKTPVTSKLLEHLEVMAEKTDGKSPADLAKYINTCAMQAIYDKKKEVTLSDFENAMNEPDPAAKKVIGFHS